MGFTVEHGMPAPGGPELWQRAEKPNAFNGDTLKKLEQFCLFRDQGSWS